MKTLPVSCNQKIQKSSLSCTEIIQDQIIQISFIMHSNHCMHEAAEMAIYRDLLLLFFITIP